MASSIVCGRKEHCLYIGLAMNVAGDLSDSLEIIDCIFICRLLANRNVRSCRRSRCWLLLCSRNGRRSKVGSLVEPSQAVVTLLLSGEEPGYPSQAFQCF